MNRPTKQAPVSEGQEVEVQIESVGEKGDGVARVQGFVIFVPDVRKGDWVKIRIEKVNPSVGFAKKVADIDPKDAPKNTNSQRPQQGPTDEFGDLNLEDLDDSESFGEEE